MDHDNIKAGRLPVIPARFTAEDIVADYKESLPQSDKDGLMHIEYGDDTLEATNPTYLSLCADGVLDCLDGCLRSILLYKPEWEICDKLKQENSTGEGADENAKFLPRKHYGLIHLLRMLTKLNRVFEILKVAPDFRDMINANVYDFLMFVSKKHSEYYDENADYQPAVEA